jgi:hypothetical protein
MKYYRNVKKFLDLPKEMEPLPNGEAKSSDRPGTLFQLTPERNGAGALLRGRPAPRHRPSLKCPCLGSRHLQRVRQRRDSVPAAGAAAADALSLGGAGIGAWARRA